jgi:hypothetical protein
MRYRFGLGLAAGLLGLFVVLVGHMPVARAVTVILLPGKDLRSY